MTETTTPIFEAHDDLRHRVPEGQRMRDSLFWELIMPEEEVGLQVYLYATERGKAGFNIAFWGAHGETIDFRHGEIGPEADFDDFRFEGLHLTQPEFQRTATLTYESDAIKLAYDFTAVHEAFSYHQNPDGLPAWMATNRYEQCGQVKGFVEVAGRRIEFDRIGHRDHSWGVRDWAFPHHWKWFIAYNDEGRSVNGWIHVAQGEIGCAGYVRDGAETVPVAEIRSRATYDDDMVQTGLEADLLDVTGRTTHVSFESFGAVKLPTPGKVPTLITEAACRATIDGVPAAAQFETHWPQEYLDHLKASLKR